MLRWQSPTRWYRVSLQRDLFGGLSLVCTWGGLANKRGNGKILPCANLADARLQIRAISKERRRHGYRFVVYKN